MTLPDQNAEQSHARRLASADRVIATCRELYPVRGLIVSPDITRAFEQVKRQLPEMAIHRYPSGSSAEDWEVPPSWEAVEASITCADGRVVASLADSFLLVAPHSEPVDGWFSKAEIAPHCRSHPTQSNAFMLEHRHAYNHRLVDWGITLPKERWDAMDDSTRYHVVIRTSVGGGELCVGDCLLPGRRPEVFCLCSQFDELCNDGQASAVFAIELFKWLKGLPGREFTYHLLLVPEMFGTLFFAHHHRELVAKTVAMLNLETLAAGAQWVVKRALKDGGILERAIESAMRSLDVPHNVVGFFDGYGNDERVYSWPGLGVPGVGLQRFPFDEYHSQFDTPDILDRDLLATAFEICEATLGIVEANAIPGFTGSLPPWLTKHDLYFDATLDRQRFDKLNNRLLYAVDGACSLLRLACDTDLPFDVVRTYLGSLRDKGLVAFRPLTFEELRAGT